MNELIFLFHSTIMAIGALIALYLGKEALTTFVVFSCIISNIFIIKQITIFNFEATAADAFVIGAAMGINLLHEYYGRESARKALWIMCSASLFFTLLAQIHLWYIPNCFDTSNTHFCTLFSYVPRIIAASLICYLITQTFENWLYSLLKKNCNNRFLILRNWITMSLTQLFDTILFSCIGLYGIVHNIGHIIIISYAVKLLTLCIMTPYIGLSKRLMKSVPQDE